MKIIDIDSLKPGMKLAQTVLNDDGTVELLAKGSMINERQIELLQKQGIIMVAIETEESPQVSVAVPSTPSLNADTLEKTAKELGHEYDAREFKRELEEIELHMKTEVKNIVNKNMTINLLTGEGNIPIDQSHEELINDTKAAFEVLKSSNELDLEHVKKNVEEALPDMIRNNDVLMRLSQLKQTDDYTFEHSFRVSILAAMIGKWLGYSKDQIEELASAGLLFDMGKMKIPDFVLKKQSLTPDEMEVVKRHAQFGYNVLLKTQGVTPNIKYSALQHHERMDGSGYPLRLKSGQIHEFAKIIMVCDIFDAMTNDRPYRKKISPFKAAEYIAWQSGVTLDPRICYIFLSNISEYFTGKKVRLSTGEIGTIIYVDVNFLTRPTISIDGKIIDLIVEKDIQIEEFINS